MSEPQDVAIGDTFAMAQIAGMCMWEVTEQHSPTLWYLVSGDSFTHQVTSDLLDTARWRRVRCL